MQPSARASHAVDSVHKLAVACSGAVSEPPDSRVAYADSVVLLTIAINNNGFGGR